MLWRPIGTFQGVEDNLKTEEPKKKRSGPGEVRDLGRESGPAAPPDDGKDGRSKTLRKRTGPSLRP